MNFFFDGKGYLLKSDPESVCQGSNNANTVYFMAPFRETYQVTVSFMLPDGRPYSTPVIMTSGGSIPGVSDDEGRNFSVWYTSLISPITALEGIVVMQFTVYTTDSVVCMNTVGFTVNKGVPSLPTEIPEPDIYKQILQVIDDVPSLEELEPVAGNPDGNPTAELQKIKIGDVVYVIPTSTEKVTLFPELQLPYAANIEIQSNNKSIISELTGDITLTFGAGVENMDNEWAFVITQGDTAYAVNLPEINWVLGTGPLFDKNSTTYCMLYYVGDTLCGEWRSV